MLKKIVSILLIISILLLSVVPSFAVGELAISGLTTLATSLGFTSVAPLLGIVAGIIAAGIVIDANNLIPLVTNYVRSHWNATQTESLTAAGTTTGSALSNDAVINFTQYATNLANSTARDTLRLGSSTIETTFGSVPKFSSGAVDFNRLMWQSTYDPAIIGAIYYRTDTRHLYLVTFNYINHDLALFESTNVNSSISDSAIVGGALTYRYSNKFGCSFAKGNGYLSPDANASIGTSSSLYSSNVSYINSHWGYAHPVDYDYTIIYYPNSGYNTYATNSDTGVNSSFGASTVTPVLTDNTVIGIPSTWTQPTDDDDIFVIPDVGALAPGNVIIPDADDPSIPGVIGGSIAWEDAPAIDEPDSSLPEWTFRIPILGSIARLLQWLGNLLKQLGNWITSLWETIVGWWTQLLDKLSQIIGSITSFFADCRQFFRDLLDLLKGSDLARFVSAVLGFISGYTLYNTLFTAYLPQCVAAVLWAAWLTLMCFWILRMVLDR